ncbi:MAG: CopG family transcriptional regulator [Chloroflexota bacterium]
MALTKRVDVLFDPEFYGVLEQLARSRGETIGALVRQAVEQQYVRATLAQRRAAWQGIVGQEMDFGSWEEVKAELERGVVKAVEASGH